MRQFLTYGSVRGVPGNRHPYRDEPHFSASYTYSFTFPFPFTYMNVEDTEMRKISV